MPLHDWTDDRGWDSVHHLWISHLLFWLRPRLPAGFRARLGSVPGMTITAESGRPDVGVRRWQADPATTGSSGGTAQVAASDYRAVVTFPRDPQLAIHVVRQGQLVAAIELVSPRNKDRPTSREHYTQRYLGYLWEGINLLLVDVHRRPVTFSFADEVAKGMGYGQPPCPSPHAISWDVGGPLPEGGRFIDTWQRRLTVGANLPVIPLALAGELAIEVDLEPTYAQAAADAYCE